MFYAVLCSCLITASLACVDDAASSAARAVPGGWFEQDLTWENGDAGTVRDIAVELAQFALDNGEEVDDTISNWQGRVPDVDSEDIQRVYSQVVSGMNYCIEFTVQHGQGNALGNRKLHCQAKVYKPLRVYEENGSQKTTATFLDCDIIQD